ncbi:MAG: hypothetical protein R3E39_18330 [Anaerolineae bacterium]
MLMTVLRDETRNRWSSLEPDKFIVVVLNGALNDQIKLALTFISVYSHVTYGVPAGNSIQAQSQLRHMLKSIRSAITNASEILNNSATTLPASALTPEGFITHVVSRMRKPIAEIDEITTAIQQESALRDTLMPGVNGRMAGAVAGDAQQYTHAITQLLDFAEQYVLKRQQRREQTTNNTD